MSLRKGKKSKAYCGLIYGMPGCGKTTLLANRKGNFFIGTEPNAEFDIIGLNESKSYEDFLKDLSSSPELARKNGCDTIVVDHLSEVEKLCKESFCGENENLATWKNGHGAGYQEIEKRMFHLIKIVKEIQSKKMNVIFLGHAEEKLYNDIISEKEIIIHRPALDKRVLQLFSAFTDFIFLIHRKTEKGKGLTKSKRFMYTAHHETIFAKKRGGLEVPDEIEIKENDNELWEAVHNKIMKTFLTKDIEDAKIETDKDCEDVETFKALRLELAMHTDISKLPDIKTLSKDKERLKKGIIFLKTTLAKFNK